jgi:hypothetical protein
MVEKNHHIDVHKLEDTEPPDTEAESLANKKDVGFPYSISVEKLMYTYVTCRLDIGYAMVELS